MEAGDHALFWGKKTSSTAQQESPCPAILLENTRWLVVLRNVPKSSSPQWLTKTVKENGT